MPDPRDTYDLEPEQPEGAARPARAADAAKAKLDKPGLLEGFEEDADFDKDPELERVITGGAKLPVTTESRADTRPDFGQALFGGPVHWAVAGGLMLVGALIATGVNAPNKTFLRIALTLYTAALHTGTGVVAVYLAATLNESRVRSAELAAARMFAAVSAFLLVFRLNINLFGPSYKTWRLEELLLATLAYLVVVVASFRLVRRNPLIFLIGSHFLLWLVVQVGMELAAAVAAAPAPAPVPAVP
jgi:hypothetical protein